MNWRPFLYQKLCDVMVARDLPATSVFAGGSLTGSPAERPFIIYRMADEQPQLADGGLTIASNRFADVWVYDDPGAYDTIDAILADARRALCGQVAEPGAHACEYQGIGPELFDDDFNALCRVGTFKLTGAPQ